MQKLALDVGKVRIGVAISQGSLALPHSVIENSSNALTQIQGLVAELNPKVIYVGLPLSLSGSFTPSTHYAVDFARGLSVLVDCEIRFIDERLTSKSASGALRSAGKNSKQQKSIIDASAAAVILDFALSSERDGYAGKRMDELDA